MQFSNHTLPPVLQDRYDRMLDADDFTALGMADQLVIACAIASVQPPLVLRMIGFAQIDLHGSLATLQKNVGDDPSLATLIAHVQDMFWIAISQHLARARFVRDLQQALGIDDALACLIGTTANAALQHVLQGADA